MNNLNKRSTNSGEPDDVIIRADDVITRPDDVIRRPTIGLA